jgi:hypothetical protein
MIGIQNNVKAPTYNWLTGAGQVLEVAVNDAASNGVNMVVQVCELAFPSSYGTTEKKTTLSQYKYNVLLRNNTPFTM